MSPWLTFAFPTFPYLPQDLEFQGSYSLESQGRKYLLHRGHGKSGKVREFENLCIKSQGKSGKKIPIENEVSRSTFGSQNCFP